MARKNSNKFFLYSTEPEALIGVNEFYHDSKSLTLQDLIEFLKEKNIEPSAVMLPDSFKTVAKV